MLNKMIAAHIKNLIFAIAILTASCPIQAQEDSGNLGCIVTQNGAEGDWVASRGLTASEGWDNSTRDAYEWRPKEGIILVLE
ncbi:MAG TPA: hypothetical protein VK325_01285 [Pseudoxanthomonas sp.]|nr:hypothetical protein [Pseudoxanthomonas sp.]